MKNLITQLDKLENYPKRTGINKDSKGFLYDDYFYKHLWNFNIWGYTEKFLCKHIGQPYSEVFHEYLEKIKEKYVKRDNYYTPHYVFNYYFSSLHRRESDFYIDDSGLIQENFDHNHYKRKKGGSPVIEYRYFIDENYPKHSTLVRLKYHLGKYLYNKGITEGLSEDEYYNHCCGFKTYNTHYYGQLIIQTPIIIDNWDELSKNRKKQIKKELSDKKAKESRISNYYRELELENLLHDVESKRAKQEQEQNIIDRDRLGFDETSFKKWNY